MHLQTGSKIVVVDDEKELLDLISESLKNQDYSVIAFNDPKIAIDYISKNHVDLVLSDLIMGDCSGDQVLKAALEHHPDTVVILMTAHPTVEAAISGLKLGAYDFLVKPFKLELLQAAIKRGLALQKVLRDNMHLRGQVEFLTAANACAAERDLDGYLAKVLASCRTELVASGAAIIQIDPVSGSVVRKIHIADNELSMPAVLDEEVLKSFSCNKSKKPIIRKEKIKNAGSTSYRLLVSKPICLRRTLHGVVNLLIHSPSGKITSGELDILTILTNSAAAAIGNENLYRDLQSSYLQAIRALANSIEARDQHTAGHTDRVTTLATNLAVALGWDEEKLQELNVGCTLHDIGKIGVPDAILNKPSRLSSPERDQMEEHPHVGLKIVKGIDLFKPAVPYIISHHERFDGSGYPDGLKGEKIPVEGRLLAVVDTFDAILSDRPYRKGAELAVAIHELVANSGTQFDPEIVNKFLQLLRNGSIDLERVYDRKFDTACLYSENVSTEKAPA